MSQPDGLEGRVAALEVTVAQLVDRIRDDEERLRHSGQDAAAARVLAGGADRDVSEIRAEIRESRELNLGVLNAMRADMTDLRQHVDHGSARVDQGFGEMRSRLDASAAGQQQIVDLLGTLTSRERDESPDQDHGQ